MVKNAITSEMRSALDRAKLSKAVLEAAEAAGKQFGEKGLVSYLEAQAIATPSPFMSLLTKAICEPEVSQEGKITHIEIIAPQLKKTKKSKNQN